MMVDLTNGVTPDNVVRFVHHGEPRSKQRPMVTKNGTFTRPETVAAEREIRDHWRSLGVTPFEHHVVVSIDFFNGNRRRRDLDNMAKLVLDALNGEAYDDDHQVVELNARKFFTDKENARTVVTMREVVLWSYESETIQPLFGT